ncbi:MAG: hypothetical protein AAF411_29245 [Myxococcota bacterium]
MNEGYAMIGNEWPIMLLVFGPAVLGLIALVTGVLMLATKKEDSSALRTIFGVIFIVVALGIGGCYGMMVLG